MVPTQNNTYILDIKNIEIFYLPFGEEVKQNNHYFDINWNNIKKYLFVLMFSTIIFLALLLKLK